jgi:hypothetical protein
MTRVTTPGRLPREPAEWSQRRRRRSSEPLRRHLSNVTSTKFNEILHNIISDQIVNHIQSDKLTFIHHFSTLMNTLTGEFINCHKITEFKQFKIRRTPIDMVTVKSYTNLIQTNSDIGSFEFILQQQFLAMSIS